MKRFEREILDEELKTMGELLEFYREPAAPWSTVSVSSKQCFDNGVWLRFSWDKDGSRVEIGGKGDMSPRIVGRVKGGVASFSEERPGDWEGRGMVSEALLDMYGCLGLCAGEEEE